MRLSVKLIGGFRLVAAIALAVGIIGWVGADLLKGQVDTIGNESLPEVRDLL